MFKSLGLFDKIVCPARVCDLKGCLFAHQAPVVQKRKLDQVLGTEVCCAASVVAPSEPHKEDNTSTQKKHARRFDKASSVQDTSQHNPIEALSSDTILPGIIKFPVDKRYIARTVKSPAINIRWDPKCPLPHESRLHFLRLYKAQFERIYAAFDDAVFHEIVHKHAIEQEAQIKAISSKSTYKSASKIALVALQKREQARDEQDTGIYPDYTSPIKDAVDFRPLVHSVKTLEKWGFTIHIPSPEGKPTEEGNDRICDRCGQRFIVTANEDRWLTCTFHPGRSVYNTKGGTRVTEWSCCHTLDAGCTKANTHVFKISHPPTLAAYHPYMELPESDSQGQDQTVVALDCEMIYTTASMELARVSVLNAAGALILDEHVLQNNKVLDYNTRFSGITLTSIEPGGQAISRSTLMQKMIDLGINKHTIMIGHGLENDLTALRLVHHNVIDSAILFPHPRGNPYRNSLKFLVKRYLNRDIQMNPITPSSAGLSGPNSIAGHDPTEDAKGALDLVIWRARNGSKTVGDDPFRGKLK